MTEHNHNCSEQGCNEIAIASLAQSSLSRYCKKIGKKNISDLTCLEIVSAMYESLGVPEIVYNPKVNKND